MSTPEWLYAYTADGTRVRPGQLVWGFVSERRYRGQQTHDHGLVAHIITRSDMLQPPDEWTAKAKVPSAFDDDRIVYSDMKVAECLSSPEVVFGEPMGVSDE